MSALHRVVADDAVAQFEASFAWAGGIMPPAGVLDTIRIPAAAASRLDAAAQLLKTSSYSPDEIITGTIVEVRHEPDGPFGQISVQTMRRGRPAEVKVRLGLDDLNASFDWARDGRPVLCEGRIRRSAGRPLLIDRPIRVHPLDETYLPAQR